MGRGRGRGLTVSPTGDTRCYKNNRYQYDPVVFTIPVGQLFNVFRDMAGVAGSHGSGMPYDPGDNTGVLISRVWLRVQP